MANLTLQQVAGKWGVSRKVVRRLVERGVIPPPIVLPSGQPNWPSEAVAEALETYRRRRSEIVTSAELRKLVNRSPRTIRRWLASGPPPLALGVVAANSFAPPRPPPCGFTLPFASEAAQAEADPLPHGPRGSPEPRARLDPPVPPGLF